MGITRRIRNKLKGTSVTAFRLGQRIGFDLLPRHFYSSIPDVRELQRSTAWRAASTMVGVRGANVDEQLAFVESCCPPDIVERLRRNDVHAHAVAENGEMGYGPIEADFLYALIRSRRPPRVAQVGAGVSTAVILLAAQEGGFAIDVCCVDPYPTDYLRRSASAGRIRLIPEKAQEVDLSRLTDVGPGGMLFVDSTHTVKVGSEVNRIVLEVLPRLAGGTLVHFHDIYFPFDYPREVLQINMFPGESTLLHAFLACNDRFTIRAALSMLHYAAPDRLRQLLPNYAPAPNDGGMSIPGKAGHFPSSIYLEVAGA